MFPIAVAAFSVFIGFLMILVAFIESDKHFDMMVAIGGRIAIGGTFLACCFKFLAV
jgi:hypothetical protein